MKVLALIALVCIATVAAGPAANPGLQRLQREVRSKLLKTYGIIPELDDPLRLNDTTLVADTDKIKGTLSIIDSIVEGLSTLTDDLRLNLFTLDIDIDISIAHASIRGQYDLDVQAETDEGIQHITGHGAYSGRASGIEVSAGGRLQVILITNRVRIINVRLSIDFDSAEDIHAENAAIDGVPVDWAEVNENAKEIFAKLLADYYNDIISEATKAVNEVLGQFTLAELIAIIIGAGGGTVQA